MAAYTSAAGGAWDSGTTWGTTSFPSASGDTVSIGHAVTAASCDIDIGTGTLTVTTSGSLVWGSTALHCGNVSQANDGAINTGTGTWHITGTFTTAGTGATTVGTGGVYLSSTFTHGSSGALTVNGPLVQSSTVDSYALTTLATAKTFLGVSSTTDDALISAIINRVSDAIEGYCGCRFASQTFAERLDGTGDSFLYLSARPITAITRVSIGTEDAMSLTNSDSTADSATASVSATTLTLRIHGGTNDGTATLTLSGYADVDALATAINALGTGWAAAAVNTTIGGWTASDLGKCTFMGWECFDGDTIYLQIPEEREYGFQFYADEGYLYASGGWPMGYRNIFVDYTAGYPTIPDDLEQIALDLVKRIYDGRERDDGLTSERLGDYAWTRAAVQQSFDAAMLARLGRWRWIPLGA